MKKTILSGCLFAYCLVFSNPLSGFELDSRPDFLKSTGARDYEIVVLNRPLAKVHGKTISVMDVKKRMDLYLHEHHSEVLSTNAHRYQFYAAQWRETLSEMIHNELVKMEAEELKVTIPDGDIKEEMLNRFGPNVFAKLDEYGLTYDEAKQIANDDIVVRNMTWYRVWARVLQLVKPETIKQEYEAHIKTNPPKDEWVYRTLTIKSPETELAESIAKEAYDLLSTNSNKNLKETVEPLMCNLPKSVTVTLSDEVHLSSGNLSPQYLSILKRLPIGSISMPETQMSRSDNSAVKRIFYLVDYKQEPLPQFAEFSAKIYNELIQRFGDSQRSEYYAKLRKRFCCEDLVVDRMFSKDYQPFYLR